ncbi:MarR family transcriptional regulator [Maribacter sp. 4U21]|jgi:DNA-binding MarR family transcriptional regulator|uniref:MarR family winged helix-turn-helix transcriptional regulator n=1 Tax=Maribacter sp. 4U21 TaxID=1889779 RepID=UPI000C154B25|nr:MarR family transcriptional regulator [Maribacter sp. 4U21]PIB30712.1 MarR family transcriptional regulator [Maribacter sp. 4U21]
MSGETFKIDFETSIGPWLGRTVKMVDYHLQEAFDRHGLDMTKEQMVILKKLHEQDGINQNELASLTYRDKSSLARLISKMESKKYIRRVQSKEDKRNNEIFITEEGLKILAETRPVIQEVIDVMEQGINKEDKALIINTLKKVQNNFNLKSI